jgi:glycerol-3-phosphate O-acyltransferase
MAIRVFMAFIGEKGYNVEWSIEGGRTRTRKLRPPRLGLIAYLVDVFRQQDAADIYLLPTAIVYDHHG